jgi:A/G-specific adenine glycosylase
LEKSQVRTCGSLEKKDVFAEKLLEWFAKNRRDFSWRNTRDPYKIFVAEMMLQKTTSRQVADLFERFIKKYPSSSSLAKARVSEIKELITPLGMELIRANRFKKCAKKIVDEFGGKIPDNRIDLLALPGVGDYIANSILCIAFDKELPLLDTNIVRVLTRVFGIESSKARARTDKELWDKVARLIPKGKARDFNLGIIDFGALVCLAKNPKCNICPMSKFCLYFKEAGKI